MIKAITFDLDGVYFVNGKLRFIAKIEKLGVSREDVVRVFLKSDEMNRLYKKGKMTDQEFWSFAIKEWGLNLTIEETVKMLVDGYEVNNDLVKVVRNLRKNGFKTCICSNNFPARINGLHKRFGFLNDFDVITLSYEVGAKKPSLKIFYDLISKAGVKPEEIIFTDDKEDNVAEAKKIGIKAFFYEDLKKFLEELKNLGVNW